MKKLSIEYVRDQFMKKGYTLLSNKYEGAQYRLNLVCPNNHRCSISWLNFKSGTRCKICFDEGRRVGINKVRKGFEKEGYVLLTNKYVNNKQRLNYICPNGHRHITRWDVWIRGVRCPSCVGLAKPNIRFIKEQFEKEGYILLTKVYENSRKKLDYICPKGHKHFISWNRWVSGRRCPICAHINYGIKFSGPNSPSWKGGASCEPYCDVWLDKDFKDSIKQRDGYKCLNPSCWGMSKRLAIHHIDYIKKNCDPKNLITLCTSCNTRANKDRWWHKAWYQAIIYRRYGFKYGNC